MELGRTFVAGHKGMVGAAVTRRLRSIGVEVVGIGSKNLDLRNQNAVYEYLQDVRPQTVVMAAARVGGIAANNVEQYEFLTDNLQIQMNILSACVKLQIPRVLFLGSSCVYPRNATQPIREEELLTGPLEDTNMGYAVAKIAGLTQTLYANEQLGLDYISVMPSNLYGPYDNFNVNRGHVLPALIHKFHSAKVGQSPTVTLWGDGSPRREFLHVDDLADALIYLLSIYHEPTPINVGTGEDISISKLADLIQQITGFSGEILWDTSKPNGTERKLLDVSRMTTLGWQPKIPLKDGLESTYRWYLDNLGTLRQ